MECQHSLWHLRFMNDCSMSSRTDLCVCQISGFNIDIVSDVDKSGKMWQNQSCNRELVNTPLHIFRYTYHVRTYIWKNTCVYLSKDSMKPIFLHFSIVILIFNKQELFVSICEKHSQDRKFLLRQRSLWRKVYSLLQ